MQFNNIACFLSAVQSAATKLGKREVGAQAVVHAYVSLGQPTDRPGFGLKVVLRVEGVDDQAIIDTAHEVSHIVATAAGINRFIVNRCAHTAALCAGG